MNRIVTILITLVFLLYFSHTTIAQDLEIAGKAKVGMMDKVNTADLMVVRLADGTLGIRDVSSLTQFQKVDKFSLNGNTLELSLSDDGEADKTVDLSMFKELPSGTTAGEMLYWNGTAWIKVATGNQGQVLSFVSGAPTWVTTVGPTDVYSSSTGKIWMDRNLGATQVATGIADADSYGDLYQWGRNTDGHQIRTSGTTITTSGFNPPGHGDFILSPLAPNDWLFIPDDNLWQGVNGMNNPCPAGYRIPTEAEWEAERVTWSTNNAAGAFASPLKLPVAGFRGFDGILYFVDGVGLYWSDTVLGSSTRHFGFSNTNNNAGMGLSVRAQGSSVRCIKAD